MYCYKPVLLNSECIMLNLCQLDVFNLLKGSFTHFVKLSHFLGHQQPFQRLEGSTSPSSGTSSKKTRPLPRIWSCRLGITHIHVRSHRTLVRLCLVQHGSDRSRTASHV